MTEEEAKTKICPKLSCLWEGSMSLRRVYCLGSECGWWKWIGNTEGECGVIK